MDITAALVWLIIALIIVYWLGSIIKTQREKNGLQKVLDEDKRDQKQELVTVANLHK